MDAHGENVGDISYPEKPEFIEIEPVPPMVSGNNFISVEISVDAEGCIYSTCFLLHLSDTISSDSDRDVYQEELTMGHGKDVTYDLEREQE